MTTREKNMGLGGSDWIEFCAVFSGFSRVAVGEIREACKARLHMCRSLDSEIRSTTHRCAGKKFARKSLIEFR